MFTLYFTFNWKSVLRLEPCSYCYAWPAGTVDHVDAGIKGINEIVPACRRCNETKSSEPLLMFLFKRMVVKTARAEDLKPKQVAQRFGLSRREAHELCQGWRGVPL